MSKVLFVLGTAGSGKTKFAKDFIKSRLLKKDFWCLIDKDTTGEILSDAFMSKMGLDPNDRDSPEYKSLIRDLEYKTALKIAKEQLSLGINVVMPGPWTKEINDASIFNTIALDFDDKTQIAHIYVKTPVDEVKNRIFKRNKPRDGWKIKNWDLFSKSLAIPDNVSNYNVFIYEKNMKFKNVEDIVMSLFKKKK